MGQPTHAKGNINSQATHVIHANKQRGSALTVAIFVIVVMALLGVALVRVVGGSSASVVAEVSGARALAAANSGLDLFLPNLFPLGQDFAAAAACPSTVLTPVATYDFGDQAALASCESVVQCRQLALPGGTVTHFRIEAVGTCVIGSETYSRAVLMEATDATVD